MSKLTESTYSENGIYPVGSEQVGLGLVRISVRGTFGAATVTFGILAEDDSFIAFTTPAALTAPAAVTLETGGNVKAAISVSGATGATSLLVGVSGAY